jgi:acyl carrier protein
VVGRHSPRSEALSYTSSQVISDQVVSARIIRLYAGLRERIFGRYSCRCPRMPTLGAVQQTVIDVLKEVSRRPIEPTLESDLVADLGFDSLQVMEVLAELEGRFDIAIPLDELTATRTVAQVVARVAALVDGRQDA